MFLCKLRIVACVLCGKQCAYKNDKKQRARTVFKSLIMTAAMASSMTMGALKWYEHVQDVAGEVTTIYDAAQQIDPWTQDSGTYYAMQNDFFDKTGRLEGLSKDISDRIGRNLEKRDMENVKIQVALDFAQAHERFLFQPKGAYR